MHQTDVCVSLSEYLFVSHSIIYTALLLSVTLSAPAEFPVPPNFQLVTRSRSYIFN
jgi:hypothetical protein